MLTIVPIVEGHGEVAAVPILIRRLAEEICPGRQVAVPRPIRAKRNQVVQPNRLEDTVQLAAGKGGSDGRIMIILDTDADCPAKLAPELLERAAQARRDRKIAVVLPKVEFEAWFLAAAPSIAEQLAAETDMTVPNSLESISDPKKWLSDRMPSGRSYRPTLHQPALTSRFDMALARQNSPSFDKMWRSMEDLLTDGG